MNTPEVPTDWDVAVVGAGWAGCAAALAAARGGQRVLLLEATRTLGGRARALALPDGRMLDNGQHILIGAYSETLALLRSLGADESTLFLRLPMQLLRAVPTPNGAALRGLRAGNGPWARLNVAQAVLGARGWSWADKGALARVALRWELTRFGCAPQATVAEVCRGLSPRVLEELIEPLCVSALNTPAQRASGSVFLRVLRDALFAQAGGSDYLIPKCDLSALLPQAAARELVQRGGAVVEGARVNKLIRDEAKWLVTGTATAWTAHQVILAAPAHEAARLAQPHAGDWANSAVLPQEAIATVYLSAPSGLRPCSLWQATRKTRRSLFLIEALGTQRSTAFGRWWSARARAARPTLKRPCCIKHRRSWASSARITVLKPCKPWLRSAPRLLARRSCSARPLQWPKACGQRGTTSTALTPPPWSKPYAAAWQQPH
jgi:hydroxysqualene dehydroxylase